MFYTKVYRRRTRKVYRNDYTQRDVVNTILLPSNKKIKKTIR